MQVERFKDSVGHKKEKGDDKPEEEARRSPAASPRTPPAMPSLGHRFKLLNVFV